MIRHRVIAAACGAAAIILIPAAPSQAVETGPTVRAVSAVAEPVNSVAFEYKCAPGEVDKIGLLISGPGSMGQATMWKWNTAPVCDGIQRTASLDVTEFLPGFGPIKPGTEGRVVLSMYAPDNPGDEGPVVPVARHETRLLFT